MSCHGSFRFLIFARSICRRPGRPSRACTRTLRECILDGTLTPGTKLSQVSLAKQLGVSRTPLREVLRMLQEEGLVEIEPNQRTRVARLAPRNWTTCTRAASCSRRSRCR